MSGRFFRWINFFLDEVKRQRGCCLHDDPRVRRHIRMARANMERMVQSDRNRDILYGKYNQKRLLRTARAVCNL